MTETKREYAQALFALAVNLGNIEEFSQCLTEISEIVSENPEYLEFLGSPAIPLFQRLEAIDEAFGTSAPEHIVSFLKLLCENRRIGYLQECIEEFELLKKEALNCVTAKIYSVIELTEKQKTDICRKLETTYNKTISPEYIVDPSIIGGIKVELGDSIIDGSVSKNLKKVRGVMN